MVKGSGFTYHPLQIKDRHSSSVHSVSIAADGRTFVSGSKDFLAKVWVRVETGMNSETFEPLQILEGHQSTIKSVYISQDASLILCESEDDNLSLWTKNKVESSSINYKDIQTLGEHEGPVRTVSLSSDGRIFVSGSTDNKVLVWGKREKNGLEVFELLQTLQGHSLYVSSVIVTSDAHFIFSASGDKSIKIWVRKQGDEGDSTSYQLFQTLEGHSCPVISLSATADGGIIVSGSGDSSIKIWVRKIERVGSDTYQLSQTLEVHSSVVNSVSIRSGGGLFVSGCGDKTVRIWVQEQNNGNLVKFKAFQTLEEHQSPVYSVSVSGDGGTVASGDWNGTLRVWVKINEGNSFYFNLLQRVEAHSDCINSVSLSQNGRTIVSGSSDKTLKVWRRKANQFSFVSSSKLKKSITDFFVDQNRTFITQSKRIVLIPNSDQTEFFNSLLTSYYFSSIFCNSFSKESIIESLNHLYESLPSYDAAQKTKDHSKLLELHHGINPLIWFCVFRSSQLLKKALKKWSYQQSVYKKSRDFDPFFYSLKSGDQDLSDVWADYFFEEENRERLVIDDKIMEILMKSPSKKIQQVAINEFKGSSTLTRNIEPIHLLGLDDDGGFVGCESANSLVGPGEKNQLLGQEDSSKVGVHVVHESTFIPTPEELSRLSPFLNSIKKMTPENRLEMRPLIRALYNKHRRLFYLFSLLNLIGNILFFMTIVFQVDSPAILFPFYTIYSGMLVFEIIDILTKGLKYFSSVYNWFDVLLYPVGMGLTSYVILKGYDFLENETENFLVVLVLYLALLRAVSMLRVLDSTRYLILMILRVYLDMTPFFVILLFYIIGNACIYILIKITKGEKDFTLRDLKRSSDVIYNWGYGNWDDPSEMNDLTFLFYLHTGLFIGLIMFNLLIAIISGTYEQFTEDRVMIDLNETLDMLSEMANFLGVLRSLKEKCLNGSEVKKVYYHFLVPNESEEEFKEIQKKLGALAEKQEVMTQNQMEIKEMLHKLLTNNSKSKNSTSNQENEPALSDLVSSLSPNVLERRISHVTERRRLGF